MESYSYIIEAIKIIITVSVFFVWFVRYKNIKREFVKYKYPRWFRDLVGILKISFSIMIHSSLNSIVIIGSLGISILMVGAFFTHMRINNPFREYIASLVMLTISGLVLYFSLCVTN